MNIKVLRKNIGLSQREFGERLGLTSQSITKYESGAKVSSSVEKLIRYEFAEFLPEKERLVNYRANDQSTSSKKGNGKHLENEISDLKKILSELKRDKDELYKIINTLSGKSQ